MQTTNFNIPTLNNTNVALELKNAIISLEGVSVVSINVNTCAMSITFDSNKTKLDQIVDKITTRGHYIQ